MSVIPQEHLDATCRPGQSAATCRYLSIGPDGWGCLKGTPAAALLDDRADQGTMTARSDNCDGTWAEDDEDGPAPAAAAAAEPQVEQAWDITHTRKGPLTVRVIGGLDAEWLNVELLAGRVRYVGDELPPQPGDLLSLRRSLVTFQRRRTDLEAAEAAT